MHSTAVAAIALFLLVTQAHGDPIEPPPPLFPAWARSLAWNDRTLHLAIHTGFRSVDSPTLKSSRTRRGTMIERRFPDGVRTLIDMARTRSEPAYTLLIHQHVGAPDEMWKRDAPGSPFRGIPVEGRSKLPFAGPVTYADLDLLLEIAGWTGLEATVQPRIGSQLYPRARHHGYYMATVFPKIGAPPEASAPFPTAVKLREGRVTAQMLALSDKVVSYHDPRVVDDVPIAGKTVVTVPATGGTAILTVEGVGVNSDVPEATFPSPDAANQ